MLHCIGEVVTIHCTCLTGATVHSVTCPWSLNARITLAGDTKERWQEECHLWRDEVTKLEADRDSLLARVERLREALRDISAFRSMARTRETSMEALAADNSAAKEAK